MIETDTKIPYIYVSSSKKNRLAFLLFLSIWYHQELLLNFGSHQRLCGVFEYAKHRTVK